MPKKLAISLGVMFALIVIMARAAPHEPNLVPIGALALWAGAYLNKGFSVPLVLATMFVGNAHDLVTGQYPIWLAAVVYVAMIVFIPIGGCTPRFAKSAWRIAAPFAGVFIGSMAFFFLTNGAAWMFGGLYPRTATGLATCLVSEIKVRIQAGFSEVAARLAQTSVSSQKPLVVLKAPLQQLLLQVEVEVAAVRGFLRVRGATEDTWMR